MTKKYIATALLVFGFMGIEAKKEASEKDFFSKLDTFGQNPYELMMQGLMQEAHDTYTSIVKQMNLLKDLTSDQISILKELLAMIEEAEQLFNDQKFKEQEVIFTKLIQLFEKKGMTEEQLEKRAQKECPLAYRYTGLMLQIAPKKEVLTMLLFDALLDSVKNHQK